MAITAPPVDRVTLSRLRAWREDLEHIRPMTRLMLIDGVLKVVRAAEPGRDWVRELTMTASLKRSAGRGDQSRKYGRILSSKVLFEAGVRHATEGADAAKTTFQTMKHCRDGIMIAMLAVMPLRRRAFAGLKLGDSVHLTDEKIFIALPEKLTKTGQPWEATVPRQIAPNLRRYITNVRSWMMTRGNQRHDFLWVNDSGRPFEEKYLSQKIGDLTLEMTGVQIVSRGVV